jgi:hypothetical protein
MLSLSLSLSLLSPARRRFSSSGRTCSPFPVVHSPRVDSPVASERRRHRGGVSVRVGCHTECNRHERHRYDSRWHCRVTPKWSQRCATVCRYHRGVHSERSEWHGSAACSATITGATTIATATPLATTTTATVATDDSGIRRSETKHLLLNQPGRQPNVYGKS